MHQQNHADMSIRHFADGDTFDFILDVGVKGKSGGEKFSPLCIGTNQFDAACRALIIYIGDHHATAAVADD